MVDGVSLGTGNYGGPVFPNKMPASMIEKIEIIRGPGSALYGADAFSGVINVTTKKYDNIENQAGARYGSFNTAEGWAHLNTELEELKMGLAVSLVDTDGDEDRVIQEDGLKGAPFSLAPGPLNTQYTTLYLHADLHYKEFDLNMMASKTDDSGTHSGAGQNLDPVGRIENKTVLVDLKHTNKTFLKDTTIYTNVSFTSYDIDTVYNILPAGAPAPFTNGMTVIPGFGEDSYFVNSRAVYDGLDDHTLSVGIGYRYDSLRDISWKANVGAGVSVPGELVDLTGTQYTFIPEVSRNSLYALLQDEYTLNDTLNIVAGARYDYYDDFGSTFNPRLAVIWQQSADVTVKTMYGRAFRAPSFSELYLRNNPLSLGNKDLDPETIDTYEIELDYRAAVSTKLNLFYYEAKDLITYVDNPDSTKQSQNSQELGGYGLELDLSYDIYEKLNLSGNYAYVHAEYADTKRKVEDVAPHQVFTQLEYKPTQEWSVNAQYFYFSKRYRVEADTREALDEDSLVHLTLSRKNILEGLDALVSARNLFDSDYREPSDGKIAEDYPMEGLNVFAELRYRF